MAPAVTEIDLAIHVCLRYCIMDKMAYQWNQVKKTKLWKYQFYYLLLEIRNISNTSHLRFKIPVV